MAMEMQERTDVSHPQEPLAKSQSNMTGKGTENPSSRPLNSSSVQNPSQSTQGAKEELNEPKATVADAASAPVSDLQKKFIRAERFGMPVQLSEEEKRSSRAERFGTGSTSHKTEGAGKSEEQKRKDRAERFGLTLSSAVDDEAKKKARLSRFASSIKPDGLEDDKKKARAIRFSQDSAGAQSLSKSNELGEKAAEVKKTRVGGS